MATYARLLPDDAAAAAAGSPHAADPEAGALPYGGHAHPASVADTVAWRAVHAGAFGVGGVTFVAGTAALYASPPTPSSAYASAVLYTVGSLGFLAVDVQELVTYAASPWPLRANIGMSAAGSTLYVLGSLGFLPPLFAAAPAVGAWGFIGGSALIGVSQAWKTARLAASGPGGRGPPSLAALAASADTATAVGVEAGAGVGAACFLVGTAMFACDTSGVGPWWGGVLALWMAGSVAFTAGACFLAWRHFVMRVT